MKRIVHFEGIDFDMSRFIGLSDIKTYQVGSLQCDWVYGFDMYLEGAIIPFQMKRFAEDRDEYKKAVLLKRDELLRAIKLVV